MTISKPPLPFQGNKSRWISVLPKLFKQIDADVIIDAYGGSGLLSHIAIARKKRILTISKPPLPFQGNKSHWISVLPKLFKQIDADVIVDAYGGSGLLSHIAKLASPRSKVYYNDYDNYSARLAKIDQTNALKERIWQVVKDCEAGVRLPEDIKSKILDLLPESADFITISTWLCFSGRYAKDKSELAKCGFYRALSSSKAYAKADDYLQDVTLTRQDALELIRSLQTEHAGRRILLVLDPPYIQTSKEGYKSGIA